MGRVKVIRTKGGEPRKIAAKHSDLLKTLHNRRPPTAVGHLHLDGDRMKAAVDFKDTERVGNDLFGADIRERHVVEIRLQGQCLRSTPQPVFPL